MLFLDQVDFEVSFEGLELGVSYHDPEKVAINLVVVRN